MVPSWQPLHLALFSYFLNILELKETVAESQMCGRASVNEDLICLIVAQRKEETMGPVTGLPKNQPKEINILLLVKLEDNQP